MLNYTSDVDILVNGHPIKKYPHQGNVYIESRHSVEYSIRIRNGYHSRKLYVVSVDGINVINGEAGGASRAGYIVNGYSSIEIKGFRTSNSSVNAFQFSAKHHSYAAKSDATGGDTSNCGVIGVAVYDERPTYRRIPETLRGIDPDFVWGAPATNKPNYLPMYNNVCKVEGSSTSLGIQGQSITMCSDVRVSRGFDMGTEFSDKEVRDEVVEVPFDISSQIDTITIFYASLDGLQSMGIALPSKPQIAIPNAFPNHFCKPPRK